MGKRKITQILILILLEILCTGIGMGVPILNILLGFPLGWHITRQITHEEKDHTKKLKRILNYALFTASLTFIFMAVLWGPTVSLLFDPVADFENFGHPFILFDPKLSFIGWLVLMIFISPFLRLLTTIFSAFIALAFEQRE
jgi:hypothetical protein